MQLVDLTQALTPDLAVWPGDPPPRFERLASLAAGDDCNLSALSLGAHCGTHVDAPAHYLPAGTGVDQLPLAALVGPAWLAECDPVGPLDAAAVRRLDLPADASRLLLRTRTAAGWRGLTARAAHYLVERGVILVGVDGPSVAPLDELVEPHRCLLSAGVVVVEGLVLAGLEPGWWQLACLPLKVALEGAPARVVAWRDEV